MAQNLVLIAGATGQIGASVARHVMDRSGWDLVGLSRRVQQHVPCPMLAVDLLDAEDCRRKLGGMQGVTHVVYAARYDHAGGELESVDINLQMLSNLLTAVKDRPDLRHIHVVHGTKYYGHNAGPGPVPYRENAPRSPRPVFYYAQQDFLIQQQGGQAWDWSISRPHTFCDLVLDEPRSITLLVAIYASMLKELGLPLRFPGTQLAFKSRTQFTWLPMLARSIEWMITDRTCANQAFNVVNGDAERWSALWPAIADYFDMACGDPEPERLARFPESHSDIWCDMVSLHGLRPSELSTVAQWAYGDYVFSPEWDVVSSMDKAREHGLTESIDTRQMWRDSFDFYRSHKIIP
ncbi:NAD-dependent dehydratase [Pollutimonas nitritireducens]|uniref:NAD-dependent dehydratase n=1 Tax=Pollutimonas nitritireducens TaxID=2045209 RepID=A0A2N4UAW1_9BURK|nr:NAD-dependent epimerase/dehydratase family protein [Pollutimonas nitritireducens]PLC52155.1 NAD-dependent dehydratase [Pollutimonas nitritireducens]